MTTQLPPDYEDRHTLALALCQHLGINPQHLDLDSLQIELGPDARHRVTWTGHAHLNLDDLTDLILKARGPDLCPGSGSGPHGCARPPGHDGYHLAP